MAIGQMIKWKIPPLLQNKSSHITSRQNTHTNTHTYKKTHKHTYKMEIADTHKCRTKFKHQHKYFGLRYSGLQGFAIKNEKECRKTLF